MSMPQPKTVDPLQRFREGVRSDDRPVPLVSTKISVDIKGGIAAVTTARSFRNIEQQDIEPTMTFPIPVDAVLCSLKAKIGDRELVAVAEPKTKARESYEEALDQGKSAVLHEELIKGVHMLSVGRVAPGAEVTVTSTFVVPLSFVGDACGLRIPTTVGEIFGRSPLLDSDDLTVSDVEHHASVTLACDNGSATLLGGARPVNGVFDVALDAPIDIVIAGWKPRELTGVSADGRGVALRITPLAEKGDAALDLDVLSDRSGSMNDRAEGGNETRQSKFELASEGLCSYANANIRNDDRVRAWEFNGGVDFVGEATGPEVSPLFRKLRPPSGSTELGLALDTLLAREGSRNVVLLTDGKSWAFDPQKYARSGMRVTAVLIGEDALEGRVSHLAGLTGGQVFVPLGSDVPAAVRAAINAARAPFETTPASCGRPEKISIIRRGARIEVEWTAKATAADAVDTDRWVGALAAYLALPSMEEGLAAALASEEGIVCHLTSLVLVDEAAEMRVGVPATRKVALTRPRTAIMRSVPAAAAAMARVSFTAAGLGEASRGGVAGGSATLRRRGEAPLVGGFSEQPSPPRSDFGAPVTEGAQEHNAAVAPRFGAPVSERARERSAAVAALARAAKSIDWDAAPDALRKGDLSSLSQEAAEAIRTVAEFPDVAAAARKAGVDPLAFVVALLARAAGIGNRTANRIAKATLSAAPPADVASAASAIGL